MKTNFNKTLTIPQAVTLGRCDSPGEVVRVFLFETLNRKEVNRQEGLKNSIHGGIMKNQEYAGYAWARFGPTTDFQLKVDVLSCASCLTEKEKKDLESIDDLLMVNLPGDEKYFCDRCGRLLEASA